MFAPEIIKNCISEKIADGAKSFIIYPCGDNGNRTKDILLTYFSINPQALVDNKKASDSSDYININDLAKRYDSKSHIILTVENASINSQMYDELKKIIPEQKIINLLSYHNSKVNALKEKLKNNLCLSNILPYYNNSICCNDLGTKIKIRIVHGHFPTWNVIKSICEAILEDESCDLKLIIGWNKDNRCVEQAKKYGISYEMWDEYDAKYDQPDVLLLTQPYDTVTQVQDVHKYAKIVVVASVLLIRNTARIEWFWKVQEAGFARFNPDYYLCDSMLYNEIKGTNTFPIEIIEMGNAKYDGIFERCHNKVFPSNWNKIKDKKTFLWTTDHGYYPDRVIGVTFDLYAKALFEYIISHTEIGVIFRPHPVLLEELIKEGYWTGHDLDNFKKWCDNSPNILFDDSETYDNAYSVADAIVADAICGITVSALPTLKPVCVAYRTQNDIPFHPELVENYYSAHDADEVINFFKMVCNGEDPMYEQRKQASLKFVKNFDGKNGLRIKEFIIEKFNEKANQERK